MWAETEEKYICKSIFTNKSKCCLVRFHYILHDHDQVKLSHSTDAKLKQRPDFLLVLPNSAPGICVIDDQVFHLPERLTVRFPRFTAYEIEHLASAFLQVLDDLSLVNHLILQSSLWECTHTHTHTEETLRRRALIQWDRDGPKEGKRWRLGP